MQPLRRLEELAAQILELAERFGCHRTAAPTRGCPLEDRPDEREAALLAGKSTDHLHPTSGLPEGALEQVGVPDAAVVLGGEGREARSAARLSSTQAVAAGERGFPFAMKR